MGSSQLQELLQQEDRNGITVAATVMLEKGMTSIVMTGMTLLLKKQE